MWSTIVVEDVLIYRDKRNSDLAWSAVAIIPDLLAREEKRFVVVAEEQNVNIATEK